ncbi:diguanylate cyclase [Hydrogenimonas sp. SS33]|uniref:diguanylate cyclase n=1 Tax=Hydrogenimonas leucolamina TaxID=2954236 RepID=UPI00336C1D42
MGMKEPANKTRYKILGALIGGLFLTAAAAWLPMLINWLVEMDLPASIAVDAAYGLFFILAALVSYAFVTELIRARIQIRRCDEVLNTPDTAQLHDRQLFYSLAKKEILLAKRHGWPVSMIAIFIQPMKGPNMAGEKDVSVQIRDIVLEELKRVMRASDLAGSFTKNEYLLFLPNCSAENVEVIAQRIMKRIESKKIIVDDTTTYHLDCKCGVASLAPEVAEIKRLARRALEALDKAKEKQDSGIASM